mmetsp:Transcript_14934/g.34034  ORF Transcript_14934/g.34034 Transcript_14934/m.34034 type:complete len:630 (+) Transcript_14934:77-1966(+)
MPTVSVFQDSLQEALGKQCDEKWFEDLCFEFGLELDDVTSERDIVAREQGEEKASGLSDRIIFKVDVPANRYDLLCIEGLVRALKIFQGLMEVPRYSLNPLVPMEKMQCTVAASAARIRPFIVCAILRGVTFQQDRYQSFIDLQDKLHQNICRKRTLVAIGTHDLTTLSPPFTYEALPPEEIVFVPLNQTEKMDGRRLMQVFSEHRQLKEYLPIIRDSPVYPVVLDSKRTVLSLPPIINGEHSKIRLDTKDVFIECTATDLTKATIVLNTVVTMFSEHCVKPFEVEPVEVVYAADYPGNMFAKPGDKLRYPKIEPRPMTADISRVKRSLSLETLTGEQVRDLLRKMSVPCDIDKKDTNLLQVQVPVTRSDIMHECDLVEDLAIAYGYNNLTTEIPGASAGGAEQPINHLSDMVRVEMANAGYVECLNWALLSNKENFTNLRREAEAKEAARISTQPHEYFAGAPPVSILESSTKEFEIVRTSLLPGVLKTLASNKKNPIPLKIFEVGDVVVQEPTREVGARNVRRIAAVNASTTGQFSQLHGALDQLMFALNVWPEHEAKGSSRRTFRLDPSTSSTFIEGRQASIVVGDVVVGVIGELHPETILPATGFDVGMPTAAFELNVEPFLEWL